MVIFHSCVSLPEGIIANYNLKPLMAITAQMAFFSMCLSQPWLDTLVLQSVAMVKCTNQLFFGEYPLLI